MPQQPRVLFVDDEDSIRMTLPPMLEVYGFNVNSVATVPDALRLISQDKFDVLIADLNVGSPGDGLTVVSAMRRTQPKAVTFILTGYPDIETALQAIRQQVDDYLIKPTEIESLVEKIRWKLSDRKPSPGIQPKRLTEIIEKNSDWIVNRWLAELQKDPEISAIILSDVDRKDHIARVLQEAVAVVRGAEITAEHARAAALHGTVRRKQGYSAPLVVREAKLLLRVLAECVQQNLLAIQVSNLIPDMAAVWETIQTELEISLRAFLDGAPDSLNAKKPEVAARKLGKGKR